MPIINFEVLLEEYPELKIVNEGARVRVYGMISDVDKLTISLEDARLEFLD